MIYDIFLFHSELDILELRLNILDKYVDKFVIVECEESFNGDKKPLYFEENKVRYSKWKDKIIHGVIRNVMKDKELVKKAKNSPLTGKGEMQWLREYYIKESIMNFLDMVKDNDLCFYGDCDEIWDPEFGDYSAFAPIRLKLDVRFTKLNNHSSEEFWGTSIVKGWELKQKGINEVRANTRKSSVDHGWHFTYQGGKEQVERKLRSSFANQVFGVSADEAIKRVNEGRDMLNRPFTFTKDEEYWPEYLKNNRDKWKHLCL